MHSPPPLDETLAGRIAIVSPLAGWLSGLDEVPDPVFAQRMLGDGIAIDPTGDCLHAPCGGEVTVLQPSGHAVTIRTAQGAEILMHIGLDTVALKGEGFAPCVAVGDHVAAGAPLIRFDLDAIACAAPATITPVLLLETPGFALVRSRADGPVQVGDAIFALEPQAGATAEAVRATGETVERTITVPLAHGIHARPAARIRDLLGAHAADVTITKQQRSANARSPVGLLTLAIGYGDEIQILATGPDAAATAEALAALIESGMGEKGHGPAPVATTAPPAAPAQTTLPDDGILTGVTAAPGLAVGQARRFRLPEVEVDATSKGAAEEQARLDAACTALGARLDAEIGHAAGPQRAIIEAHRAMLGDADLRASAAKAIQDGASAGIAWRTAIAPQAEALAASGDARLAERADDLRDLERRVLLILAGAEEAPLAFPANTILIADDLLPSQVTAIDPRQVIGLCVEKGGPTSHAAILAANIGLPMLVSLGPVLRQIAEDTPLILDAGLARLQVDPSVETLDEARRDVADRAARRAVALAAAAQPCHMADGTRIEVFANLGSQADAALAITNGAEGSGLLRTEFLFLDRETAPSVDEQAADYQAIADTLGGRPLIIRLLDIGGDKPAPYLPIPAEENPALGLRGIRVGFAHPQLLEDQIRAILCVQPIGQCRIMIPMIAGVDELRRVREVLDRLRAELGITEKVELGVMVETPAAAVTADLLAAEADFLSIGTNDLTQYALAMDRGNASVASAIDGLHPAVLRLIADTCKGAASKGRWTGVCGGLASDPLAVPILIGLGVTELSATAAIVPEIKALVSGLRIEAVRAHAQAALACATAADVRALAREFTA